jgi:hypothetical protein
LVKLGPEPNDLLVLFDDNFFHRVCYLTNLKNEHVVSVKKFKCVQAVGGRSENLNLSDFFPFSLHHMFSHSSIALLLCPLSVTQDEVESPIAFTVVVIFEPGQP